MDETDCDNIEMSADIAMSRLCGGTTLSRHREAKWSPYEEGMSVAPYFAPFLSTVLDTDLF